MLTTGKERLERIRDARRIYLGKERVEDVTRHPAFRNAALTVARLYEAKADPANRDTFTFEEDGGRFSIYYLRCRTREDLARRTRGLKAVADMTYGLFGRSPDHVAGMITGLAMNPAVFDQVGPGYGDNLRRYYAFARANDIYPVFACIPPTGIRDKHLFPNQDRPDPTLKVVGEDDTGVFISGMKMLATGAAFADEIWIGNLTPLSEEAKKESITCAVPVATPGLSLWARQAVEGTVRHEVDYPLSYRYDESDCVVVCDRVKVPWERVFVHDNGTASRAIYIQSPANCFANHQSNVRFWAKMALIVGLSSRICKANGIEHLPPVRETLGRLCALEATIGGLVQGQIEAWERFPDGYACYNRRIMYAALNWCQEHHNEIIDTLRTLVGGNALQMPASIDVVDDPVLSRQFHDWWATPSMEASARMRLYKLVWDLIGSEFAGRHMLYEKFYAGNSIIVRNQSDREAPWTRFHGVVDGLLDGLEMPAGPGGR
ncbi:MAG: hypothetical protein FJX67_06075 [Alphaproteobacteria bacterium]|nr:hypothetical protein [Alphaproteobacteria bacterium]